MTINHSLSAQEKMVLHFTANGHTTKEMAHLMRIAARTADTYKQRIMLKLRARTMAHAVYLHYVAHEEAAE